MAKDPIVFEKVAQRESPKGSLPLSLVTSLLDFLKGPLLVADRNGQALFANSRARQDLREKGFGDLRQLNLLRDLFHLDAEGVVSQLESGEREMYLPVEWAGAAVRASLRWLPEPNWLAVYVELPADLSLSANSDLRHTLEDLLQEREITYRNLLAAYLRLQEVNRQKTVFLASAAHELKTPLAVMKGYYDLVLSGSLGKLNQKQFEILEEAKESCERLVRLVSMFLNYSTLESGKLVLHLRESDLRDCLAELVARWQEIFHRKQVRLETRFDPAIGEFRFDYQKVQQAVANLLDNALKHTPAGGTVSLIAEGHFWERRVAQVSPSAERRSGRHQDSNSVLVSVADNGPGIAAEFHQEIFEDFVRVDRSSSGMGLGLAIAKRLVQAHRGKIWVDSEPSRGSTFTFLLPTEME